uniref:CARD domain-containing protein n=1 Tax=Branchiostoma floridae TaxID=7739 RepID=C3YMI3_BRAFL|eukprot:XP_002602467.1 hypothetical protein BRAFLDRAFT_86851 [Branchiostoma floridae]
MPQLPALTLLLVKISQSLTVEDVRDLRALIVDDLGAARVENARPLEIFNMLKQDNKIGNGDLGFLVQILRSLGKGRLAEEAEQLEQLQRSTEVQVAAVPQQTVPMSGTYRTLLLRNYPTIYLELDATRVLDYLHQQGVLTDEMRQTILAIPEDHHRTGTLLQMILQMGENVFTIFRTALGHAGYPHLMELLTGEQQHMPQSLERRFDEVQAKVEEKHAIIVRTYRGCVILFLTFESEPKFAHFWGSYTSGDLSNTLSELLITKEMRSLEGGDQLVVRTLVLEQDYRAWRDFFNKGDPQLPEEEQVEQVTSHLAALGTSRHTEELEITQKTRAGSIRSIASVQSENFRLLR